MWHPNPKPSSSSSSNPKERPASAARNINQPVSRPILYTFVSYDPRSTIFQSVMLQHNRGLLSGICILLEMVPLFVAICSIPSLFVRPPGQNPSLSSSCVLCRSQMRCSKLVTGDRCLHEQHRSENYCGAAPLFPHDPTEKGEIQSPFFSQFSGWHTCTPALLHSLSILHSAFATLACRIYYIFTHTYCSLFRQDCETSGHAANTKFTGLISIYHLRPPQASYARLSLPNWRMCF
jgi:hypothetical protein